MSLADYDALLQSISTWSKRPDLSNIYPDFVTLAEKQINKGLQLRSNEKRATSVPNTDDRFVALPADFLEMRSIRIIDGTYFYDMFYKTPEAIKIWPTSGRPYFYTVNSKLEFDRIPDKSYTFEMTYYVGLSELSETNTTNNVLTKYPELYLYGSLAALHRYARDEETATYYDMIFEQKLASANAEEDRGRYGPAPAMSYEGMTP